VREEAEDDRGGYLGDQHDTSGASCQTDGQGMFRMPRKETLRSNRADLSTHLVRRVTDADVKIRQISLDEIANDQLEFLLLRSATSSAPSS
jgi:hypothetical protein